MIREYITAALKNALHEIIEDEEPCNGEISEIEGVWATGNTLEECRENLTENLEGWILVRTSQGMDIPTIDGYKVTTPTEMKVA